MSQPSASRVSALLQSLPRRTDGPLDAAWRSASTRSALYIATHARTEPPATQVVTTERQNILLRQFHARAEQHAKKKRGAGDADAPPAKRRASREE